MQETDLPLGVSRQRGRAGRDDRRSRWRSGLFDAVQATWNLHERAAGDALARAAAAG